MGSTRVPLINQVSMSVMATTALTSIAVCLGSQPPYPPSPSTETVPAIDDVLTAQWCKICHFLWDSSTMSVRGNAVKEKGGEGYCSNHDSLQHKDVRIKAESLEL